ncbi:YceI family protein [Ferruginibacter profundus]
MTNETKWTVDTGHSEIAFKVRHLMIAHVKGSFRIFDANIYTTGKDFTTAQIDLWIDTASITTGDEKRDEHLKSADFFDVEHHKQITFTASTMQQPDEKGHRDLWGALTMKGITKNVKLNVEFGGIVKDPWGNEKAGFTVTGKIKRSDWELTWNNTMEAGGLVVGDEISITCELELINAGKKDLLMEVTSVVNEQAVF